MPRGGIRPVCSVPGCGRPHAAKGMCKKHYSQDRDTKLLSGICKIKGCQRPARAKGYCSSHHTRYASPVKCVGCGKPIWPNRSHRCITCFRKLVADRSKRSKCSIDGCERIAQSWGMCQMHYGRVKRGGSPFAARKRQRLCYGDESYDTSAGVVYIYLPGHHLANKRGLARKTRVVFEQIHRVRLQPGDVVRFKDGDRSNYSPDNLVLWQPAQRIASCLRCGRTVIRHVSDIRHRVFCGKCRRGNRGAAGTLTDEQVLDIRCRLVVLREGKNKTERTPSPDLILGNEYGMSRDTIARIRRGEAYCYLPVYKGGSVDEFILEIANYRS